MDIIAVAYTGHDAIAIAQDRADMNGAPARVWEGVTLYHIDENPDDDERIPLGWVEYAIVEPSRWDLGDIDTVSGSSLSETERCGLASAGHADDTGVSPSPRRA